MHRFYERGAVRVWNASNCLWRGKPSTLWARADVAGESDDALALVADDAVASRFFGRSDVAREEFVTLDQNM